MPAIFLQSHPLIFLALLHTAEGLSNQLWVMDKITFVFGDITYQRIYNMLLDLSNTMGVDLSNTMGISICQHICFAHINALMIRIITILTTTERGFVAQDSIRKTYSCFCHKEFFMVAFLLLQIS